MSGRVRRPWPKPADGEIENHKERFIKNPLPARLQISTRALCVHSLIHIKSDRVITPLHGEDMKIVRQALRPRQSIGRLDAYVSGVAGSVDRTVNRGRLLA